MTGQDRHQCTVDNILYLVSFPFFSMCCLEDCRLLGFVYLWYIIQFIFLFGIHILWSSISILEFSLELMLIQNITKCTIPLFHKKEHVKGNEQHPWLLIIGLPMQITDQVKNKNQLCCVSSEITHSSFWTLVLMSC